MHVMVNSLCTSLNSFTDPTVCGLSIAHGTFHLRGSVRAVHKQRLTDVHEPGVKRSTTDQTRCATSTSAQRADCRRNRGRGPPPLYLPQLPASINPILQAQILQVRSDRIEHRNIHTRCVNGIPGKLHGSLRNRPQSTCSELLGVDRWTGGLVGLVGSGGCASPESTIPCAS